MAPLRYSHALVCRVSSSFAEEGSAEQAKLQHETYVRTLRDLGLDVIEMPPDETLPYCVYIEDTAIICNGIALIAKPKDEKRLKEVILYVLVSFFYKLWFIYKFRYKNPLVHQGNLTI